MKKPLPCLFLAGFPAQHSIRLPPGFPRNFPSPPSLTPRPPGLQFLRQDREILTLVPDQSPDDCPPVARRKSPQPGPRFSTDPCAAPILWGLGPRSVSLEARPQSVAFPGVSPGKIVRCRAARGSVTLRSRSLRRSSAALEMAFNPCPRPGLNVEKR